MNLPANFKWIAFSAVAVVLAWRIMAVGMSDYHMQTGSEDAAAALQWHPGQPDALLARGKQIAQQDPLDAITHLEQAIRKNPTEGRSYALLGQLLEKKGEHAKADKAFEAAARVAPQHSDVQAEVAAYWMRRGDLARALKHWNVVLTFRSELHGKLFPALLTLTDDARTHPAFALLLQQPVAWWPNFFDYAAVNAPRLDTVRALFQLQGHGANAASETALRAYLGRLQREGLWSEAYFVWLNSLPKEQLGTVGNLFNGNFETPSSNLGFDWITRPAGHILVETAPTYGSTGQRALHIVFRGPRVQFQHFYQYTMLPPGNYSLHGRARPENLETARGLEWNVFCQGSGETIGKSERFLGTDHWRHFAFQFQVPDEGCSAQQVRLELAGQAQLDYDAKGSVWFDDLIIERLN